MASSWVGYQYFLFSLKVRGGGWRVGWVGAGFFDGILADKRGSCQNIRTEKILHINKLKDMLFKSFWKGDQPSLSVCSLGGTLERRELIRMGWLQILRFLWGVGQNFRFQRVSGLLFLGSVIPIMKSLNHTNPLQPGIAHIYLLKESENLKVFWSSRGV